MRNALTKAVTKAKPSRPLPNAEMNVSTSSLFSSISTSRVMTSVPSGRISSIRPCTVATSAPSSTATSMASTCVSGAEDVGGGLRVPRGERRAGEPVAVTEPDEGGDRELVAAGVGEHGDRVADFEVLAIGGRLVDRHLVGA